MADDNATALVEELADSLTAPEAPVSDALEESPAPVAEPTNAEEDRYIRLHADDPDYDEVRTALESSPRLRELTRQVIGRQEKAQYASDKAAWEAEKASLTHELNQLRWKALPPEVQQKYQETNHPVVQMLQQGPPNIEAQRTQAYVAAETNALFDDLRARGVPQQRLAEIVQYGQQGAFGTGHPLQTLDNFRRFVAEQEIPYWSSQRQPRVQPQAAPRAAAPVQPQVAAVPTTNPALRAAGPDSSPRGTSSGRIDRMTREEYRNLGREEQKRRWPTPAAFESAVKAGLFTD